MTRRRGLAMRMGRQAAALFLLWVSYSFGGETFMDIDFPNPLNKAKKGQWVVCRVGGRAEQKSTIVDIGATGDITIRVEQKKGDSYDLILESIVTRERAAYPKKQLHATADITDIVIDDGEAQVAGTVIPVTVVQYTTGAGTSRAMRWKMLLSEQVPVYGEVLLEVDIFPYPVSELTAFGEINEPRQ